MEDDKSNPDHGQDFARQRGNFFIYGGGRPEPEIIDAALFEAGASQQEIRSWDWPAEDWEEAAVDLATDAEPLELVRYDPGVDFRTSQRSRHSGVMMNELPNGRMVEDGVRDVEATITQYIKCVQALAPDMPEELIRRNCIWWTAVIHSPTRIASAWNDSRATREANGASHLVPPRRYDIHQDVCHLLDLVQRLVATRECSDANWAKVWRVAQDANKYLAERLRGPVEADGRLERVVDGVPPEGEDWVDPPPTEPQHAIPSDPPPPPSFQEELREVLNQFWL